MSKKLTLICAIAFVVALAIPAYAAVQNVKVSGDIDIKGVYANNYDLIDNGDYQSNGFYLSIARLRVDADLTDNVAATIRLINEREWEQDSADTNVDLDLAYITLKEFLYSPVTLTIGRQNLRFGNALVVGDPDTNAEAGSGSALNGTIAENLSARKSFDAIRATLDYAPWRIDLLTAKIDEVDQTGSSITTEDEDLYGINVAYDLSEYNGALEAYLFYKDDDADVGTTPAGTTSSSPNLVINGDIYTLGIDGSYEPVAGLTLAGEVAYQFGDYTTAAGSSRDQKAWALDVDGSYTWNTVYSPMLGVGYTYRSGEEQGTTTGDYEGWDPMYEDQTNGIIADYLFAGVNGGVTSNASIIRVYGSIKPVEALTLTAKYYNYTLDEKLLASDDQDVYYAGPLGSSTYRMDAKDDFGDEIDLIATYDYTEDVQFGLTAGWFMPGDAFDSTNDDNATSVVGSVKVVF